MAGRCSCRAVYGSVDSNRAMDEGGMFEHERRADIRMIIWTRSSGKGVCC